MAARSEIETCFSYCEIGDGRGYFSSNEKRWVNHVRKLAYEHPDKCEIIKEPQDNGGFIYAKMPTSWLKVSPRRAVSEEQRQAAAERFNKMWADKKNSD